ncbi:unnamed protein product [Prorocentrum cordatum]|uniref:Uncharacterized protein n=1 Tax=Prorocentrum cordatum TaxID=2364126 RepID=A0ABN9XD66_9DINO|nr:unnamed protein product [Polarella glacialis]
MSGEARAASPRPPSCKRPAALRKPRRMFWPEPWRARPAGSGPPGSCAGDVQARVRANSAIKLLARAANSGVGSGPPHRTPRRARGIEPGRTDLARQGCGMRKRKKEQRGKGTRRTRRKQEQQQRRAIEQGERAQCPPCLAPLLEPRSCDRAEPAAEQCATTASATQGGGRGPEAQRADGTSGDVEPERPDQEEGETEWNHK